MAPKLKYLCVTVVLIVALSFSFQRTAHAYVDPGSGLLAFQSISAVITGALFYFRSRLKSLFRRSDGQVPGLQEKQN
jgi:drug/metabolite transporter (DMT)-like permease